MKINFLSTYKITVTAKCKKLALNLLLYNSTSYKSSKINKENCLEIFVNKKQYKELKLIFENNQVDFNAEEICGILKPLEKLRLRFGLLTGCIIFLLTLFYSSKIVWKIEVEGNNNMTDEEIINELNSVGFALGTYIPKINYDELHNKILLNSKTLSWISINISGNVAKVKVSEKENVNENSPPLYTNVIAKSDGYIASIVVIEGKKEVTIGEVVKKGELLISGVINSQSQGVRYEHAQGEVKAYVNKEILVKIPFKSTKKVYTGNVYKEKYYKIYDFPLNFLIKYRNSGSFYDTIKKKEQLHIFGVSQIPIEITTNTKYEYTVEDVNYTVSEAVDIAFVELREQMDQQLKDSELISKTVETDYDSEYFYIRCKLYCLEDIAVEREFFIEE